MNRLMIQRITKYKKTLLQLKELGLHRAFSENLAEAAGVSSALVRKDFSLLKITGNRRGGYPIDELLGSLDRILGSSQPCPVILVGCGNLGRALLRYRGFRREGLNIVAAFDLKQPEEPLPVTVLLMEQMVPYIIEKKVVAAILAVPEQAAQPVATALVDAGIRGILNFTPAPLQTPAETVVNNINLELELETVCYFSRQTASVEGAAG